MLIEQSNPVYPVAQPTAAAGVTVARSATGSPAMEESEPVLTAVSLTEHALAYSCSRNYP